MSDHINSLEMMKETKDKNLNKIKIMILSLFIELVIISISIGIIYFFIGKNNDILVKIGNIEDELLNININMNVLNEYYEELENTTIDLTSTSFQPVGNGYSISIKKIEPHLTGVIVFGSILNSQSTSVENVEFEISIKESTKEFSVRRIKPAFAANFEVYIPDVSITDTEVAKIKWKTSSIIYSLQE